MGSILGSSYNTFYSIADGFEFSTVALLEVVVRWVVFGETGALVSWGVTGMTKRFTPAEVLELNWSAGTFTGFGTKRFSSKKVVNLHLRPVWVLVKG